jgi:hypothetical protein
LAGQKQHHEDGREVRQKEARKLASQADFVFPKCNKIGIEMAGDAALEGGKAMP